MGVCEFHAKYYDGDFCPACKSFELWTESEKNKKLNAKVKFNKKIVRANFVKSKKASPNRLNNNKKKADDIFSQYIRGLYNTTSGYSKCYTCGKIKENFGGLLKGLHCGHYFPKGKFWWLRYRVENVLPQCYDCNVNNGESIAAMRPELVKKFGEEKILILEKDSRIIPFSRKDRELEILWYKKQYSIYKNLINGKS